MFALYERRALLLALLLALPVHAFAATADEVVASAARSWLGDWARQKNWPDPRIEIVVLPLRRPRRWRR